MSNVNGSLGAAIRSRRNGLGVSLRSIATASEVSASFLSQVENDRARPRIETLHRIASALNTSAQSLLAAASDSTGPAMDATASVSRGADGGSVQQSADPADGVVRSLVSGSADIQALEIRGAPADFGAHYQHAGTELLYVVTGQVEVEVDGELHQLGPGDAINYAAELPHRTRRLNNDVHLLIVTTDGE